jgi:hypothetical protein
MGMPPEMVEAMRDVPSWTEMEAIPAGWYVEADVDELIFKGVAFES